MKPYILGALAILFLFSACRKDESKKRISPSILLTELADQHRFASTDQLAEWLIQQDPSLLLVDVRSHEEFDAFSLPGAINIPLANLLNPDEQARLNCEVHFPVFYSNGTVLAEKAWMINRRLGCANGLILKGGLNEWTATILQPAEPPATASREELELFQVRKAASLYFSGGGKLPEPEPVPEQKGIPVPAPVKKTVPIAEKKVEVKQEESEGC